MLAVNRRNKTKRPFMDILVVEDDVSVCSSLMGIIRQWGYRVENADTCKNALMKVKETRFDLILLDIFLPDGKGHELIPRIKELWPTVGIVAMTGYNSRELEREIRKQGILYYMIKPFGTGCLKELLDHISRKSDRKRDMERIIQGRDQAIAHRRHILH
jgi:two-component system response regulator HydG